MLSKTANTSFKPKPGLNMIEILPICAFSDNYIWAITDHEQVVVVDPGDTAPVKEIIEKRHLTLAGILVTHYPPDHIRGIGQLINTHPDHSV